MTRPSPSGGILGAERDRGTHVALFCATDGDAGTTSGIPVSLRAELGRLRRRELHAAAQVLGIAERRIGPWRARPPFAVVIPRTGA
ncbi:MAG: PIG-L family deacetylase [Gemmatimonadaceae bacterium]